MLRDKIRCPLCPQSMKREDYPQHFGLFHARDPVNGVRHEWQEPLELGGGSRRAGKINDDTPLWED